MSLKLDEAGLDGDWVGERANLGRGVYVTTQVGRLAGVDAQNKYAALIVGEAAQGLGPTSLQGVITLLRCGLRVFYFEVEPIGLESRRRGRPTHEWRRLGGVSNELVEEITASEGVGGIVLASCSYLATAGVRQGRERVEASSQSIPS